jgi:hypothetical protein
MVIGRGRRREHLIYENKRGSLPMVIGRGRREHLISENKRGGVVSYGYRTRTS